MMGFGIYITIPLGICSGRASKVERVRAQPIYNTIKTFLLLPGLAFYFTKRPEDLLIT